ncbi:MAG: hypothetical protein U5P41_04970 [Gammaproteobacteria bacterium]|nr:hypothetical protein [Gammaproteobacteria bacterium]
MRVTSLDVVGERTQVRERDPTFDLGEGTVADIAERVDREDVDIVVVDGDLDPGRAFNLEEEVGASVVDRTRLVLDIFADRAETKRARFEVRLAELRYELPRAEAKAKRGEFRPARRPERRRGTQAAQMRADYRQRIKHVREALDQLDDADGAFGTRAGSGIRPRRSRWVHERREVHAPARPGR